MFVLRTGVMNTQRSCLHAIISILDAEGEELEIDGEQLRQPSNSLFMPKTTILCYRVLFELCSNEDTGPATLRYLRNNREFLLRHVQELPFHGDDQGTRIDE